jgi:hypothetical protein
MTDRRRGGDRAYRAILALYPADFRRRFGAEMVLHFQDMLRDARASGVPAAPLLAWIRILADVVATAPGEHLRRKRTVAHSLTTAPSMTSRILGLAGIAAGLAILIGYVVDLPSGVFRDRLIVFAVGVMAVGIGVHRRQSLPAPMPSLVATGVLLGASAFFVLTVIYFSPPIPAALWSTVGLWLASAAFGGAAAVIGAVSRIGALAVAVGSLLALTGIDRLGLVSESAPTIFNTLSQVGIVAMAAGWIVLGLDVALRRVTPQPTG